MPNRSTQTAERTQSSIMTDHQAILGIVRGVEQMVEVGTRATGDLARQIAELADVWTRHLHEEEASPLYRDYPTMYPALAAELERLVSEHAPISAQLQELVAACDHAERIEFADPLATRIRAVVAALRRHEAAEVDALHRIVALRDAPRP
jgi:hypothetical protein